MRRRTLIWLGMALSVLIVGVVLYVSWVYLRNHEARYYGVDLTRRLRDAVTRIDQVTDRTFTTDYYHHLNHQPLLTNDLEHDPVMQDYVRELYTVVHNPIGGLALFTECGFAENSSCYYDQLFDVPDETHLSGYNPKSRPWYLLARIHPEWVVFTFLSTKQSVPGFPKIPTLGFARRIVRGVPESDEDGIWLVVISHNAAKAAVTDGSSASSALLAMLFHGQTSPLDSLELSLPGYLLFSETQLRDTVPMPVQCAAITDGMGLHYQASVQCMVEDEGIHYTFSKRYDHPYFLLGLCLVSAAILYGAWRFWRYLAALQLHQVEVDLAVEVESRLVHDLRKGILTQLNKIFDDPAPDLQRHRHYLTLLNKYVGVMSTNLRRKKEDRWVALTSEMIETYLRWTLGDVSISREPWEDDHEFLKLHYGGSVKLWSRAQWPRCDVPEMGFYRILKNIIENYNTHGYGGLTLTMAENESAIQVHTRNAIPISGAEVQSTGLGLAIMRRLLEDNFGSPINVQYRRTSTTYELEIRFPKVIHD